MKIYKLKSEEDKGYQQLRMVDDCIGHWCKLNNNYFLSYPYIMNMNSYRRNYEHHCYVTLTYHLNPNKW